MPKEGNLVPFNASADKSNTNGAHHKAASVFRPPTSEIANANGVRRPSSGSNATSIISQQPSLPGSHKRSFSEAHLNRPKKKPRLDRQPSAFVTGSSRPVPLAASTSSKPSVSNTATPGKSPGVSALGKSIPQKRPSTGPEIIEISSSDSEPPSKSTKQPIIRKKRPPKVKENETPHKTPKKSVPPIAPVATKQARPSSSLATPNTSGSTTAKPVLSHSATAPPPVGRTVATPMSQAEEGLSRVRQLISDFISVRSVNVPDTSDTVSPKVPNSTPHGNPLPFPASSRADKGKQRDPGENTGFIERSGLRKVAEREVIDVDAQSLETRKKRKRKRKKFPILVLREGKLPSTSVGLKKPLFIEPSASSELSSHTSEPIVRNPSNHKNDFATERLVTKPKKKDQQQSAIDQVFTSFQSPPPILHSKSLSLASNEKEPSAIAPTLICQSISGNKTSPCVKLAEGETGNSNSSAKPKSFAKSTGNGQDSASTFPSAWRSAATSNSSPAPSSGTDATDLVGAFASQEEDTGLGTPLSSDHPPTAAAPSSGTDAAGIVENPLGASASRNEDVAFGASSNSGPTFQGPARKSVTSSNDPNVNQPPIGKRKMASIDAGSSATKDVLQTSPPKPELPSTDVQNKQACKVLIDTKCSVSSSMELPNPQHLQNLPTSSQKETPASARSSLIVTNHISSGIKETPPGSVGSTRITRQLSPDPTTASDNIVASAAGVSSSEIVSKEFPSSNKKPLVNGTGTGSYLHPLGVVLHMSPPPNPGAIRSS
ncbi:uncharacterized protein EI90DRAFT_1898862 [Cantharellus anzutake]|uniref:uncharacterized protein n=1 Tax=Cantharellus anzutake TaxID=1750568 RepID=UPI0019074F12|nr:uncharacterized protein EI90DRAFT_1898862 [Cantharellus anzutake]KAF8326517.1 hypothetical protein EI90DRAFT_1898862 [Cantharellus anzutake]